MYLHRRGEHWQFRKAVPVDLAGIVGLPQLRRSLRTSDPALARRRALQLLIRVDEVYAILRSERPLRPTRKLALKLLDEALCLNFGTATSFDFKNRLIQRSRDAVEDFLPDDRDVGDASDGESQGEQVFVSKDEAFGLMTNERPRGSGNVAAVSLLRSIDQLNSSHWASTRDAKQAIVSAIRRMTTTEPAGDVGMGIDGLREALRSVLAEEIGTISASALAHSAASLKSIVASEIRAEFSRSESSRWSDKPLAVMIERYEKEEVSKLKGLKHLEDVKKRLSNFLGFVGNKPVRDITRDDLKDYRDHLDLLPDRFQLKMKVADIRQAVTLNAARLRPLPTIGANTVNLKYIGPVRRLFDWLVTEKLIERNPVVDIHSNQTVVEAAKSKRLPLSQDQITRLFASTSREPRTSALYWLPPLMLLTGARLNEIAQLRTEDIRPDYNGRPHLSVLCLDDDDDEGADVAIEVRKQEDRRGVKSAAARRLIPLHPELLAMGFLEFVASRKERVKKHCQVFADLEPNRYGHWSAAISKRINRRLRSLGITNPRLTAYSLRHNFRDACVSSGMADETRKKLLGHQLQGMDAVYGNPRPLPEESAAIDRLRFAGIDLSTYHTSGSRRS